MTEAAVDLNAPRLACKRCNGVGHIHRDAFDYIDSGDPTNRTHYPASDDPCNACDGSGWFTPPDVGDILSRIVATKGKNKGKLRASLTSPALPRNASPEQRAEQVRNERAYYAWRMARFHGGKDTTMPMTATLFSRGDPYIDTLEALADAIAQRSFGTNMAAAAAWGPALLGSAYKGPSTLDLLLGK